MTNPDKAGHLNEADLIEECVDEVMQAYYEDHDGMVTRDVMRVLSVLRKRHLLTDQGIEQVKASEERRK